MDIHSHRRLSSIAGTTMLLSLVNDSPLAQQLGLIPKIKYSTSNKAWTCRKCQNKFHPHLSPTLCDDCVRSRDA